MSKRNLVSLIIGGFIFVSFSLVGNVWCKEGDARQWQYFGVVQDGLYDFYVDTKSVEVDTKERTVKFIGKRALSKKGKEERWKDFLEEVKASEKETDTKVEDKEIIFEKVVVPSTTKIDKYAIDCKEKKIRRFPPMQGWAGFVIVDDISAGSTEEKIYEKYCPQE